MGIFVFCQHGNDLGAAHDKLSFLREKWEIESLFICKCVFVSMCVCPGIC